MQISARSFPTFLIGAVAGILVSTAPAEPVAASRPACEFTGVSRTVAIGDVHGAFEPLTAILRTTGLIDEKGHWSGGRALALEIVGTAYTAIYADRRDALQGPAAPHEDGAPVVVPRASGTDHP